MVIASKGAPHIEGLENSALQVSAAFLTALVLTLLTQGAPSFLSAGVAASIDWRAVVMLGVVNTGIGCLLYFSAVAKLPSRPSPPSATSSRFRRSCSRPSFWAKP